MVYMKIICSIFNITDMKKKSFIGLCFLSFARGIFYIFYINYIKEMMNCLINRQFQEVYLYIGLFILFAILQLLVKYIFDMLRNKEQAALEAHVKKKYFDKLSTAKISELYQFSTSDILTRFDAEISRIVTFNVVTLIDIFSDVLMLSFIIIYIGINNVFLLSFLFLTPFIVMLTKRFGVKSRNEYKEGQNALIDRNELAKNIVDYSDNIRAYLAEPFFIAKYDKYECRFTKHKRKEAFYNRIFWLANIAGYQCIYMLFYIVGGFLAFGGMFEFGIIISLFVLLDPLIIMIQALANISPAFYKAGVSIDFYNDIADLQDVTDKTAFLPSDDCQIAFEHLNYSYQNRESGIPVPVLENITMKFGIGQKIAVIGESGSGKSTLLKLLMGYDDKYEGIISINNIEARDLDLKILKELFSYLPQEERFLNETIEENVLNMIDAELDGSKMRYYAAMAEIDKDIQGFADSYQTMMEDGGQNISTGQRQRICLLMALIKERPMLLLDESFSAVDPDTMLKIIDNISEQKKCGMVVIMHTVYEAVLSRFDSIIIMENGRIVSSGEYNVVRHSIHYQKLEKI
ncbi:ABC transporter ATP-binding protein [bacterium D16-50]|nr:ABC transporter ATP-binding protein [bacterium D16-50]